VKGFDFPDWFYGSQRIISALKCFSQAITQTDIGKSISSTQRYYEIIDYNATGLKVHASTKNVLYNQPHPYSCFNIFDWQYWLHSICFYCFRHELLKSFLFDVVKKPHSVGGSILVWGINVTPQGFTITDDQLDVLRFAFNDYKVKNTEDAQLFIGVVQDCPLKCVLSHSQPKRFRVDHNGKLACLGTNERRFRNWAAIGPHAFRRPP